MQDLGDTTGVFTPPWREFCLQNNISLPCNLSMRNGFTTIGGMHAHTRNLRPPASYGQRPPFAQSVAHSRLQYGCKHFDKGVGFRLPASGKISNLTKLQGSNQWPKKL